MYDADWQTRYKDMVMTAEQAVAKIRPGQRVFIGTGGAQPLRLLRALVARHAELADLQVLQSLTFGEAPYALRELADHFSVNTFFVSANVRDMIQEGYGHYTPIALSDIPRLLASGEMPLDVALIQVTPPDVHGRCSLGISVDIVKSAAANAGLVIAQVNPQMPWTLGNSFLSVLDLDILVPVDEPLMESSALKPRRRRGRGIRDGRLGGRGPGDRSEPRLARGGRIDPGTGHRSHPPRGRPVLERQEGSRHPFRADHRLDHRSGRDGGGDRRAEVHRPGKDRDHPRRRHAATLRLRRQQPTLLFNPTEYVNDPLVIGRQNKMVAINTALEVDLTGQVCADSLGTSFYSGVGGQADFNQGAGRSLGGRAIIALPSTADGGAVSRIVATLRPGAGVVTTQSGRALRRDGVRHRVSARKERPRTGHGSHHDRPPRLPRRASGQGLGAQVDQPRDGGCGGAAVRRARGSAHHDGPGRRYARSVSGP